MTVTVSPTSWRTTSRDSGRAVARRTAVGPHSLVSYCGWYSASAGAGRARDNAESGGEALPPARLARRRVQRAERRRGVFLRLLPPPQRGGALVFAARARVALL